MSRTNFNILQICLKADIFHRHPNKAQLYIKRHSIQENGFAIILHFRYNHCVITAEATLDSTHTEAALMKYFSSFEDANKETLITVIVSEVRRFSLDWSDKYVLYLLLNGNIEFYSDGKRFEMAAGDLVMVNPNIPFSSISDEKGRYCVAAVLSPSLFADYTDSDHTLLFDLSSSERTRSNPEFLQLRALLARLMLFGMSGQKTDIARFEGCMHFLVAALIDRFSHDELTLTGAKQELNGLFTFETMISFIEKNFNSAIKLEDVAKAGNYNPNYVSQFFRLKAGVNFYEYLTRIRLRHAISDINNTNDSLTDIAYSSGFASSKALSRSFMQYYGISPSEYRSRIRKGGFSKLRNYIRVDSSAFISKLGKPFSESIAVEENPQISAYLTEAAGCSDLML